MAHHGESLPAAAPPASSSPAAPAASAPAAAPASAGPLSSPPAGAPAAGSEGVDTAEWLKMALFLEELPDTISNWCFMPLKKEYYGDVAAYAQYIKPHAFTNVHGIRKKLNQKAYGSNAEVLAAFHTMFGNAFRYWFDPTPVPAADAGGGRPKKKEQMEPRKNVVALVVKFDEALAKAGALVGALEREGVRVEPWFKRFPGAAYIAYALEEWYKRVYAEAYWFYYRDGCYHGSDPEDPWEDPADYGEFVKTPVYLSDVFERLYTGKYASAAALEADVVTMFDNALVYYGADAEFGAGKYNALVRKSFEDMWAAASRKALSPGHVDTDYFPKVVLTRPYVPSASPVGAGAGAAHAPAPAGGAGGAGDAAAAAAAASSQQLQQHLVMQHMLAQYVQQMQAAGMHVPGQPVNMQQFQQWYTLVYMQMAAANNSNNNNAGAPAAGADDGAADHSDKRARHD